MAEMEALLNDLKEEVTCPICLDDFKSPKTLECLHAFCCECLNELARTRQKHGYVSCPSCQAEIMVPESGKFDNLPTSFYFRRLCDVIKVYRSYAECGNCDKNAQNTSFCFDCGYHLCPSCLQAHVTLRQTKNHKVTPRKDFKDKDLVSLLRKQQCCQEKYHEQEPLRYFCKDCNVCLCQMCIMVEHQSHDVTYLEKVAEAAKANISVDIDQSAMEIRTCKGTIQKLDKISLKLKSEVDLRKKELNSFVNDSIDKMKVAEQEKISELDKFENDQLQTIVGCKEVVEKKIKKLESLLAFAGEFLEKSTNPEILQVRETICNRMRTLQEEILPDPSVSMTTEFIPDKQLQDFVSSWLHSGARIGDITCSASPQQGQKQRERGLCSKDTTHRSSSANYTSLVMRNVECSELRQVTVFNKDGMSQLGKPCGIAVNKSGDVAVADKEKHCVHVFDQSGRYKQRIGGYRWGKDLLTSPTNVAFDDNDNFLVADVGNSRIQVFQPNGEFQNYIGEDYLGQPAGIYVDKQGRIIVCDWESGCVQIFSRNGGFLFSFGNTGIGKLGSPFNCVFYKNSFLVSDSDNNCIKCFNKNGKFLFKIGQKGFAIGSFKAPRGIVIDHQGNLLVCDRDNSRIQMFQFGNIDSGSASFVAEFATNLEMPYNMALLNDGRVVVTELGCQALKVFD